VRLFLYRLAALHRVVDVDEWAKQIPLQVLRGWMAYWTLEPFGDEWARSGKLAAILASSNGAKVDTDFETKFLPSYRAPVQTKEQMIEELRKVPAFAAQMAQKGL
jgi:hypothetical protein